ncbi:GRIP1-associated protein 1-like [Poeciliopsis prolifica]|uniref:GRIP1-associated protein 1-like n=1 Tax=Poeciliopsis prolifica TaxID=188132 RepID=UPI002413D4AA|nr:GRIP1-associated protein 1-like [Poeciliopsis prolifica]
MAASQALSEEEFHRMQAQLLELRTQNYQLSDDLRKNSAELNAVRLKLGVLERDLVKAQKALNKSKKAQEVEALLSENEMLQGKLHSQEDDFRLQNSTLMGELSKLCTQIEQLETENRRLQEGGGASGPPADSAHGPADGLLRLQAENAALHKKLRALQDRFDGEPQGRPLPQRRMDQLAPMASQMWQGAGQGRGQREPIRGGKGEHL